MSNALQEAVHSPVSRRTLAVHVHGNPKQPLEQAAGVSDAESSHVSDGLTAAAPTGVFSKEYPANSLCRLCVLHTESTSILGAKVCRVHSG